MKTYFFIITLLCVAYTHTAEIERPQQKAPWFCCSADNTPKKPSAKLLQQLDEYGPMVLWEHKKKLIRKAVFNGTHPDTLRYGLKSQERFPLYDAIVNYDEDFTTFLLEHGADPNQISKHDNPLIFHAKNSVTIVHTLLNHHANVLVKKPASGETVIHMCSSDPLIIKRYCQADGDPCALDNEGQTALHSFMHDTVWCMCSICSTKKVCYQSLALLIYIGTPFDIKPSEGLYKDMSFDQVIEHRAKSNTERTDLTQTIIAAAQKRKQAICDGIGLSLSTDPLNVVFAYDGQTTDLKKLLRRVPLVDSHGQELI